MILNKMRIIFAIMLLMQAVVFMPFVFADQEQPLILLGTIVEPNPAKSFAVIKDASSEKQGAYKVGDKILDYQLVKIKRARVVLLKKGKLSLLDFPLGGRDIEPIIVLSSDERLINSSALAKKFPDINTAIKQAIVIPYIESGKMKGFKIAKLKDKAFAKLAGLREGDTITQVNGESLNTLNKPFELYQNLLRQERIDLEIKRGSQIKNLTYYMNWAK